MDKLGPYECTGRVIEGPASDLIEVLGPDGSVCTAIQFHERYREPKKLFGFLEEHRAFLSKPGIDGVAPLVDLLPDLGAAVYKTGTIWTIAELVHLSADAGEPCGVRAGLEFAYRGSQLLVELADRGDAEGVFGHGALTPWRLGVRSDGRILVLGLGLLQPEVFAFVDDDTDLPAEDSLRYVPPERLAGTGEDLSSDLYSLALVTAELITGRPLYDGLFQDIRRQAERGEGTYRLYKWRDKMPDAAHTLLARTLKHDIDTRFHEPLDLVYGLHDILNSVDAGDGPGLAEVVARVRRESTKGEAIRGGKTSMLSKADIARMAEDLDDPEPAPLGPPSRPRPVEEVVEEVEEVGRWGSVRRPESRSPSAAAPKDPSPPKVVPKATPEADPQRERLRSRLGRSRAEEASPAPASDRRDALRSRLREGGRAASTTAASASSAQETAAPAADKPPSKRDLLRSRLKRDTLKPAPAPQLEVPPTKAAPPAAPSRLPTPAPKPAAPAAPTAPVESVDDAASLLARLRGAKAPPVPEAKPEAKPAAKPAAEPAEEPAAEPVPATVLSVEEPPTESPELDDEPSMDDIALDAMEEVSHVAELPVAVAADAVREPEFPPDEPTDESEDEITLDDASLVDESSTREVVAAGEVVVRLHGERLRVPAADSTQVGEVILRALAWSGRLPIDAAGQSTGWYSAQVAGASVAPSTQVSALDDGEIELVAVPAAARFCTLQAGTSPSTRVRLLVSMATPARLLVQHFRSWLELGDGDWSLLLDGSPVAEWDLLGSLCSETEPMLEVRR